jgi:hypothetical protein
MFHVGIKSIIAAFLATLIVGVAPVIAGDGQPWRVGKSTGQVWVVRSDLQKVSVSPDSDLREGDSIRTGATGRVLLIRGEERITISPNSAIAISAGDGQYPTTLKQQAGSIVLEVEKKNVQHFEVETPYLAAVVKGTRFRVTVDRRGAKVDVMRGQVQVADFKSGDMTVVLPGQAAKVSAQGNGGLTLSGIGKFNPIERGTPRRSTVQALHVPKKGLSAPRNAARIAPTIGTDAKGAFASAKDATNRRVSGGLRIGSPLGEVKLDVSKATKGLAHSPGDTGNFSGRGVGRADGSSDTKGNDGNASANANNGNGSKGLSSGGGNGNGLAANTPGSGNGHGLGNSNGGGNGNALGNGNAGGPGNGLGNGNGNGNGVASGSNNGGGNGNTGGLSNGNGNGSGAASGGNGNAGGNGKGKAKGKS